MPERVQQSLFLLGVGCLVGVGCRNADENAKKQVPTTSQKVAVSPAVKWRGEKQSSQLTIGPHTIAIPPDWRDASELDMPGYVGPNVVSMTPSSEAHGATQTMMVFGWSPLAAGNLDPRNPPCEEIAGAFAKKYAAKVEDVKRVAVEGDAGCAWTAVNNDLRMLLRVRFQDGHQLLVQWTRALALGDGNSGDDVRAWKDVVTQLHFAN